jgi:biotin carboxyl carrier protein
MARNWKTGVAALKLRIDVDGEIQTLDSTEPGSASIEEVRRGVFSILLGTLSFTVNVAASGDAFEVVGSDGLPCVIRVTDARDRRGGTDGAASKGPAVIRAQMPGKIIKLLVDVHAQVEAGQGLIVVEAMKMQNEVKAPKTGKVAKILVSAGGTVAAGETLLVLE